MSYKKYYIVVTVFLLLFAGLYLGGIEFRYKYFHYYVHHRLFFLLDREFKDLLHKYSRDNKFSSFETKTSRGILVTYPLRNENYKIQFRLEKDLLTNNFHFRAEIASPSEKSHYDTGNPQIYMQIPMEYFNQVIERGLTDNQIEKMLDTAQKVNWEPEGLDKPLKLKPPIVLKFNDI
jgi:hypothetical protein